MIRSRRRLFFHMLFLFLLACPLFLPSQSAALRIAQYNSLNYPGSTGPERDPNFRHVIAQFDPDVLVMEEYLDSTRVIQFLNNVLNYGQPGRYAAAPFVNGYDTDNAMFYKPDKVDLISHYVIDTDLRDIDEWKFRPDGYTAEEACIRIYVVHLKASPGSDNEQKRLEEVQAMRARMETFPVGQNYMVAGDFNIYQSTEPAYINMTSPDSGLAGVVHDPIDSVGNWHDAAHYVTVHTQSTQKISFAGGATGGMDDRFDQILISDACDDEEGISYIPDSYTAFGNDGALYPARLNNAINDPPNQAVPETTANALYYASDHLPVYLDIQVPAKIETDVSSLNFGTVIVDATAEETLWVFNVATPPADELDYEFSAPTGFSAPPGVFSVDAGDSSDHIISLNTSSSGNKSGDLEIACDDVDDPTTDVSLSGTVLDHAQPSTQAGSVTTEDTLDFGTFEIGGFSDQTAQIHNYDYDALQALLRVYEAEILGGDGRFSLVGGFSPINVGATPASYQVHFDDSGAQDTTYTATLTFSTRDQQGLPGGIDLSDLVFHLFATVQTSLSPIDDLTIYKNEDTVKLIWTPKSGAELYRIYSDDQDPYFAPTFPTDSTTEATWTDPAPSVVARYYVVRGVKGDSESGDSNRVGAFERLLTNTK